MPATQGAVGMFAQQDGTLGADGHGYQAEFDARGATLVVRDPSDAEHSVGLTLQLADWRRGQTFRTVSPARVARAGSDVAQYRHDGITERYQLTATGFEQSFVLDRRPAGNGDFVLGIAVAGTVPLHAEACDARQQSLTFAVGGEDVFRYGKAVAFSRGSTNRLPVATRYDGRGRIELVVASEFLDQAAYPVIVDPAVGPAQMVSGSGFTDLNPDVAYDPDADTFMVVWQREFTVNDRRIRVQRYRRDGSPISGIGPLTGSGFATWPTVGFVKTAFYSGFYVVWSHTSGLRGQLLNSNGTGLFSPVHQLTSAATGTRDLRPTFSVRGVTMLLAWDRTPNGSSNPTMIRVKRCGLVGTSMPTISLGTEFVVEMVGTGYVQRVRMPRRHIFAGSEQNRLCWERFYPNPAPGDFDVRSAYVVVSLSTMAITDGPSNVPGAASIGVDERRPDVASTDHPTTPQTLVVWQDQFDIEAHRYDIFGSVGGPFPIRATSRWETGPAVGGGATEFSVGYLSAPASNASATEVYAARVQINGSVLASDSEITSFGGPLQRSLRASSVPRTSNNGNRPNGVMFSWLLESDSIGVINDIRAQFYEPVTANVSPFGTACSGPGGTLPTIGTNSSPYPGNADFRVELSNAPPASLAALLISDTLTSVSIPGAPGCQLYVNFPPLIALPIVTSAVGEGSVAIPIPVTTPPSVLLGFQWGVYTPGYNPFGWIASNDLDIAWNQ